MQCARIPQCDLVAADNQVAETCLQVTLMYLSGRYVNCWLRVNVHKEKQGLQAAHLCTTSSVVRPR
jgi:hypothetical protein